MILKKYLIVLTILFTFSVANGQTNIYHPFPDSVFWRVDYVYDEPFQFSYYVKDYFQYYINGDTLINSFIHKKIYRSHVNYNVVYWTPPENPPGPLSSGYIGALRDDSLANKTFFVFPNTTNDSLLYDYNMSVGDTMNGFISEYPSIFNMVVSSVDSILINGQYRKRWNFNQCDGDSIIYIIEGIGTSVGLIEPLCTYAIDFAYRYLVCVKDSSGILFTSDYNSAMGCKSITTGIGEKNITTNYSIFPNPFSKQATFHTDKFFKDANLNVYNTYGQMVKQIKNISGQTITVQRDNLPSGLYLLQLIQDNKILATDKLIIIDD